MKLSLHRSVFCTDELRRRRWWSDPDKTIERERTAVWDTVSRQAEKIGGFAVVGVGPLVN